MTPPAPPFTRLSFRRSPRIGRFLPCLDTDKRRTLVATVDALGRVVISDFASAFAGTRLIGYTLGEPSSMYDPADGLKWLSALSKEIR
ncbi:hypothetical protein [Demequina lutea]|uniref:Uncharacterized protein n=1 Tax=Demequina lutea TaxID=431489 RepID=A0A7Y9ZCK4_9MICO|nr:hypothetical protein [Demequina lutea]NYI41500.1 hypothetical protein [Demequina lutea]